MKEKVSYLTKTKTRILAALTALGLTGILSALYIGTAFAATGNMYFSPSSKSLSYGSTVTFSLRINPGTTIDSVQATVNFDTSKLQYVSLDTGSSAFTLSLSQSVSGGAITIARGQFSGVSADSLIANITLKSLVYSGTTSVTLTGANADAAGTLTNPSTSSASVTLTAGSCPSGQTGTPPNCTTPTGGGSSGSSGGTGSTGSSGTSGGSSTATAPSNSSSSSSSSSSKSTTSTGSTTQQTSAGGTKTTPATVSVANTDVQYSTASLKTTSQEPTQVYIRYGINDTLSLETKPTDFGTSHTVQLDPATLVPGLEYSYVVVAKNQQGATSTSAVQHFTTKGLTVKVGVFDKNHKPVKNKQVELHSAIITAKTDGNGYVTFNNVTPGEHHVVYTTGGKTYEAAVSVTNNVKTVDAQQTAAVQNMSVVYAFEQKNNWFTSHIVFLTLVLVLGAAAAVAYFNRKRLLPQVAVNTGSAQMASPVVMGATPQDMLVQPTQPAPVSMPAEPPQPVEPVQPTSPATPATPDQQTQPVEPQSNGDQETIAHMPYPSGPLPGSTVLPVDNDSQKEQ